MAKFNFRTKVWPKYVLSVGVLATATAITMGSLYAYSKHSDQKIGSRSGVDPFYLINDFAKTKNGVAAFVTTSKTQEVAKYDFKNNKVIQDGKEYKVEDFLDEYFRKNKNLPFLRIRYGSFDFFNEYIEAVNPSEFFKFTEWFMSNVSWGPEIITLKSFSIVKGVEMHGNSITLGAHSNKNKEYTTIKFYPDAFFGALPIYSELSGVGNAQDSLVYKLNKKLLTSEQLRTFLDTISEYNAMANTSTNILSTYGFKNIPDTRNLIGSKVWALKGDWKNKVKDLSTIKVLDENGKEVEIKLDILDARLNLKSPYLLVANGANITEARANLKKQLEALKASDHFGILSNINADTAILEEKTISYISQEFNPLNDSKVHDRSLALVFNDGTEFFVYNSFKNIEYNINDKIWSANSNTKHASEALTEAKAKASSILEDYNQLLNNDYSPKASVKTLVDDILNNKYDLDLALKRFFLDETQRKEILKDSRLNKYNEVLAEVNKKQKALDDVLAKRLKVAEQIDTVNNEIWKLYDKLADVNLPKDEADKIRVEIKDKQKNVENLEAQLNGPLNTDLVNAKKALVDYVKNNLTNNSQIKDALKQVLSEVVDKIDPIQYSKKLSEYFAEFYPIYKRYKELATNGEEIVKKYNELLGDLKLTKATYVQFQRDVNDYEPVVKELKEALQTYLDSCEKLKQACDFWTTADLDKYNEMIAKFNKIKEGYIKNTDLVKELISVKNKLIETPNDAALKQKETDLGNQIDAVRKHNGELYVELTKARKAIKEINDKKVVEEEQAVQKLRDRVAQINQQLQDPNLAPSEKDKLNKEKSDLEAQIPLKEQATSELKIKLKHLYDTLNSSWNGKVTSAVNKACLDKNLTRLANMLKSIAKMSKLIKELELELNGDPNAVPPVIGVKDKYEDYKNNFEKVQKEYESKADILKTFTPAQMNLSVWYTELLKHFNEAAAKEETLKGKSYQEILKIQYQIASDLDKANYTFGDLLNRTIQGASYKQIGPYETEKMNIYLYDASYLPNQIISYESLKALSQKAQLHWRNLYDLNGFINGKKRDALGEYSKDAVYVYTDKQIQDSADKIKNSKLNLDLNQINREIEELSKKQKELSTKVNLFDDDLTTANQYSPLSLLVGYFGIKLPNDYKLLGSDLFENNQILFKRLIESDPAKFSAYIDLILKGCPDALNDEDKKGYNSYLESLVDAIDDNDAKDEYKQLFEAISKHGEIVYKLLSEKDEYKWRALVSEKDQWYAKILALETKWNERSSEDWFISVASINRLADIKNSLLYSQQLVLQHQSKLAQAKKDYVEYYKTVEEWRFKRLIMNFLINTTDYNSDEIVNAYNNFVHVYESNKANFDSNFASLFDNKIATDSALADYIIQLAKTGDNALGIAKYEEINRDPDTKKSKEEEFKNQYKALKEQYSKLNDACDKAKDTYEDALKVLVESYGLFKHPDNHKAMDVHINEYMKNLFKESSSLRFIGKYFKQSKSDLEDYVADIQTQAANVKAKQDAYNSSTAANKEQTKKELIEAIKRYEKAKDNYEHEKTFMMMLQAFEEEYQQIDKDIEDENDSPHSFFYLMLEIREWAKDAEQNEELREYQGKISEIKKGATQWVAEFRELESKATTDDPDLLAAKVKLNQLTTEADKAKVAYDKAKEDLEKITKQGELIKKMVNTYNDAQEPDYKPTVDKYVSLVKDFQTKDEVQRKNYNNIVNFVFPLEYFKDSQFDKNITNRSLYDKYVILMDLASKLINNDQEIKKARDLIKTTEDLKNPKLTVANNDVEKAYLEYLKVKDADTLKVAQDEFKKEVKALESLIKNLKDGYIYEAQLSALKTWNKNDHFKGILDDLYNSPNTPKDVKEFIEDNGDALVEMLENKFKTGTTSLSDYDRLKTKNKAIVTTIKTQVQKIIDQAKKLIKLYEKSKDKRDLYIKELEKIYNAYVPSSFEKLEKEDINDYVMSNELANISLAMFQVKKLLANETKVQAYKDINLDELLKNIDKVTTILEYINASKEAFAKAYGELIAHGVNQKQEVVFAGVMPMQYIAYVIMPIVNDNYKNLYLEYRRVHDLLNNKSEELRTLGNKIDALEAKLKTTSDPSEKAKIQAEIDSLNAEYDKLNKEVNNLDDLYKDLKNKVSHSNYQSLKDFFDPIYDKFKDDYSKLAINSTEPIIQKFNSLVANLAKVQNNFNYALSDVDAITIDALNNINNKVSYHNFGDVKVTTYIKVLNLSAKSMEVIRTNELINKVKEADLLDKNNIGFELTNHKDIYVAKSKVELIDILTKNGVIKANMSKDERQKIENSILKMYCDNVDKNSNKLVVTFREISNDPTNIFARKAYSSKYIRFNVDPTKDDERNDVVDYIFHTISYNKPVVPTLIKEEGNIKNAEGKLEKGFSVYADAYQNLLDNLIKKVPYTGEFLEGEHIEAVLNADGVLEYKLVNGKYHGFTRDSRVGLWAILKMSDPNFKGISTDFLRFVSAHEYGHHMTLNGAHDLGNKDSQPVYVSALTPNATPNIDNYYNRDAIELYLKARTHLEMKAVDIFEKFDPKAKNEYIKFQLPKIEVDPNTGKGTFKFVDEKEEDIWGTTLQNNSISEALNNKRRRFLQTWKGIIEAVQARRAANGLSGKDEKWLTAFDLWLENSLDQYSGTLNPSVSTGMDTPMGKVGKAKYLIWDEVTKKYRFLDGSIEMLDGVLTDGKNNKIKFSKVTDPKTGIEEVLPLIIEGEKNEEGKYIKITKVLLFNNDGSPVLNIPDNLFGKDFGTKESPYYDANVYKYVNDKVDSIVEVIKSIVVEKYTINGWDNLSTDTSLEPKVNVDYPILAALLGDRLPVNYADKFINSYKDYLKVRDSQTGGYKVGVDKNAKYYNLDGSINQAITGELGGWYTSMIYVNPSNINVAGWDDFAKYAFGLAFGGALQPNKPDMVINAGGGQVLWLDKDHSYLPNVRLKQAFADIFFKKGNEAIAELVKAKPILKWMAPYTRQFIGITQNHLWNIYSDADAKHLIGYDTETGEPDWKRVSSYRFNGLYEMDNSLANSLFNSFYASQGSSQLKGANIYFNDYKKFTEFVSLDFRKAKYNVAKNRVDWDLNYVKSKFQLNYFKDELVKALNKDKIASQELKDYLLAIVNSNDDQLLANEIMRRFSISPLAMFTSNISMQDVETNKNYAWIFDSQFGYSVYRTDSFKLVNADKDKLETSYEQLVKAYKDFANNNGVKTDVITLYDYLVLDNKTQSYSTQFVTSTIVLQQLDFVNILTSLHNGIFKKVKPSDDVLDYFGSKNERKFNEFFADYTYNFAEVINRDNLQITYTPSRSEFGNLPSYLGGISEANTGLEYVIDGESSKKWLSVFLSFDSKDKRGGIKNSIFDYESIMADDEKNKALDLGMLTKLRVFGKKEDFNDSRDYDSYYFGKFQKINNGWFKDRWYRDFLDFKIYDDEGNPIKDETIRIENLKGEKVDNRPEAYWQYYIQTQGVGKRNVTTIWRDESRSGALAMFGYLTSDVADKANYLAFKDVKTGKIKTLKIHKENTNNMFYYKKQSIDNIDENNVAKPGTRHTLAEEEYKYDDSNGHHEGKGFVSWVSDYALMGKFVDRLLDSEAEYEIYFASDEKGTFALNVDLGTWGSVSENGKTFSQAPVSIYRRDSDHKSILKVQDQFNGIL